MPGRVAAWRQTTAHASPPATNRSLRTRMLRPAPNSRPAVNASQNPVDAFPAQSGAEDLVEFSEIAFSRR
jgi:hypothetical protein